MPLVRERERERGSGNASFDEAKLKLVRNKLHFCHITLFTLPPVPAALWSLSNWKRWYWCHPTLPWFKSQVMASLCSSMSQIWATICVNDNDTHSAALNHAEFKCSEQEATFLWERFWFLKRTVVSFGWSHMRAEEARTTPSAPKPYHHLSTLTLRQTNLSGIGPSLVDIVAQVQPCLSRIRIWPLGYCSFSPWQMGHVGWRVKTTILQPKQDIGSRWDSAAKIRK